MQQERPVRAVARTEASHSIANTVVLGESPQLALRAGVGGSEHTASASSIVSL